MSLKELKQKIRQRLKEYKQTYDKLKEEIHLLNDQKRKLEKYLQELKGGVSTQRVKDLEKELGISMKNQFTRKLGILTYLKEMLENVDIKIQSMNEDLKYLQEILVKGIDCPLCNGAGFLWKKCTVREGNTLEEILKTKKCPLCKGGGKLTFKDIACDE
ncbi:MAG: hypothetical protein QXO15_09875 [Nitrososphaerota archaeon]